MERKINKSIETSKIFFDEDLYPRVHSNWQTVYDYQQSMMAGAKFPPITLAVYKGKLVLVDGKHRQEATEQLKINRIDAEIYSGWDKKRIFEEAVRRNISHGKTLSPFEKRRIALKLRELHYPNSKIGDLIQVPLNKLDTFIEQRLVNSITGNEIVKSEIKHLAGQDIDFSITELQKPMHSSNQEKVLQEVIHLVEHNLLDLTNKKVCVLLVKLKKLLK